MDDCYSYPAIYPGVISGVKVLTAVTCTISIVAACWIIVTYLAFKDLRTAGRQLLLNLSIADILVAGSHFVGVMANYERFIYNSTESVSAHDPLCVSQAAVTMFSSIASFLWTMSIAVYMLAVALSTNQKILKRMVVVIYVISWGVPVPFVVVSAATKTLGFQYTGSTGCYTLDNAYGHNTKAIVIDILSYEMWVYLAYIFLPIVYLTVFSHLRCRKETRAYNNLIAASKTDIKLLLIPIAFLLLRIWTTVDDVFAFYTDSYYQLVYRCSTANAVLLFLQSIGLNSQGTVNGILFCLLTKQVRLRWSRVIRRLFCRGSHIKGPELLEETGDRSSEDVATYGSVNSFKE